MDLATVLIWTKRYMDLASPRLNFYLYLYMLFNFVSSFMQLCFFPYICECIFVFQLSISRKTQDTALGGIASSSIYHLTVLAGTQVSTIRPVKSGALVYRMYAHVCKQKKSSTGVYATIARYSTNLYCQSSPVQSSPAFHFAYIWRMFQR